MRNFLPPTPPRIAYVRLVISGKELKDVLPQGVDRTEESYKRQILKLRIKNEQLKKLYLTDDGY